MTISGAGIYYLLNIPDQKTVFADVTQVLSEDPDSHYFEQALQPRNFDFPVDLGPHNGFQTEWWYFTGNLNSDAGRPFGYQLTFFRRAIRGESAGGHSKWRTKQLYMAHFAVSDIEKDTFFAFERFSRNSLGLSGAEAQPFRVWLEDWEVREIGMEHWVLKARAQHIELRLTLKLLKPMVLNGQDGLSQKGPEKGNASYYYSNTRIESKGNIIVADKTYSVSGYSWLDREWSTSVLSRHQIGWDWFSIQFDDMREIMVFQLRKKDGSVSEFSSGSLIERDGVTHQLRKNEFEIEVLDFWRSPETGNRYPSDWKIRIPSKGLELFVSPLMKNQEHRGSFAYWEGAVTVKNEGLSGRGYVELTGYSQ